MYTEDRRENDATGEQNSDADLENDFPTYQEYKDILTHRCFG